jgi:hypothetical protein
LIFMEGTSCDTLGKGEVLEVWPGGSSKGATGTGR